MTDPRLDATKTDVGRSTGETPQVFTTPVLPFRGRIASFHLVNVLGQGGMGTVYLAEQREPVRRFVALKVMRAALSTPADVARFEGEREALARLTHPGIAQMYEAGAVDGTPWFAMEYVEGEPLTLYCDARALSLRARIELVVEVCRGVQFAHQKGIIHRDLKPGNLLVAETGGAPHVKIIDFGLAKAV
ncbi:MAG TPA: serine/threonine-protein kinase, partial [Thermoanaerobaculia bacterium]|nr:serine/threonine-protein kinase [Thermoanaerobaculia bacterium]